MRRRFIHFPLLTVLLGLAGALPARAAGPGDLIAWSADLRAGAGVDTVKVAPAPAAAPSLLLQGTVVLPAQQADVLSMPLAGVVQAVLVGPMQAVRAGQPVARIVSPQLAQWQREWLLAETQARLARAKAERDEQMFQDGIVAEHRRNESRAQAEMAALAAREQRQALRLAGMGEAALAQAAASGSLSPQLTLAAPVAGTVLEQLALPGQRLEAGSPVAQIARAGALAIELQAAREQAPALRVGDRLAVEGCRSPARITAISPQLSSATQGVPLRAALNGREDCLRINQFVQARWQGAEAAGGGLSVPAAALVRHAGRSYVFVREARGFRAAPVDAVAGDAGQLLVTSGLKAGDEVAVRGVAAIKGAWLGLGREAAGDGSR